MNGGTFGSFRRHGAVPGWDHSMWVGGGVRFASLRSAMPAGGRRSGRFRKCATILSADTNSDTIVLMARRDSDHYTYRITWSAEDGEHVGRCAEFPSLSWLARTPGEALSGIRALVSEVLEDMRARGESPPEPMADRTYSGRFVVRVPPETHRDLAIRAAEEGVSLNRLVSARLAR